MEVEGANVHMPGMGDPVQGPPCVVLLGAPDQPGKDTEPGSVEAPAATHTRLWMWVFAAL